MRDVSLDTDVTWLSGDYTGANRPMVRATIQHPQMDLYDLTYNVYAALMFGKGAGVPRELPNVKSLKWSRGVDTDVATATMELYNTAPQPVGTVFDPVFGIDQPGFYSYQFNAELTHVPLTGTTASPDAAIWQSQVVPDNVVRTFEGYGFDASVGPEDDVHLYPSGLWMIKDVEFTVQGLITVTMEDLASILRDQIAFYPVVPKNFYPLQFSSVPKTSGFTQGYTVTKLVDSGGNYDPNHPPPSGWTGPTRAPTGVGVLTAGDIAAMVTWSDVPSASVPSGYAISGYQVVIDNVRQWQVYPVATERALFDPGPFVSGNVYWVTMVAVYVRLSDGYEQISSHSAGVLARPHDATFNGACSNLALNDSPPVP